MNNKDNTNNRTSRWDNELIIKYMREKLEDSDDCRNISTSSKIDSPVTIAKVLDEPKEANSSPESTGSFLTMNTQDTPEMQKAYSILCPDRDDSASLPEYKILRSLPGYSVGDPLRKEDLVLCYSKEATAYAMGKIRPGDCAFILRSDGCFTYATYEGRAKRHTSSFSFQVDNGHFKKVSASKFCKVVKVPVLLGETATIRASAHTTNHQRYRRRASTTTLRKVDRHHERRQSYGGKPDP